MSLSEHMIRLLTTLFMILSRTPESMEKMRPHMARLQLAWKDLKQILKSCNRRGNTPRPPTPGPKELKEVVVQKDRKKDALKCDSDCGGDSFGVWDNGRNAHHSPDGSLRLGAKT